MLPYLGPRLWDDFVEHANRHYKAAWLAAFAPASGALRCVGLLDGTPCPHAMTVELGWGGEGAWGACDVCTVGEALEQLHLDHERPLHETCRWWIEQLPSARRGRGTTGWMERRCATTTTGDLAHAGVRAAVCGEEGGIRLLHL